MTVLRTFSYQWKDISFEFEDGNKMINATQMAKVFDKRVNNFLRLPGTHSYIKLLEIRCANSRNENTEILRVIKAWNAKLQWTRMHEKLALKFATWLSPEFELRVYDKIHELLTTWTTKLQTSPGDNIIHSIRLIVDQLEEHHADIWVLKSDISQMQNSLQDIEAKILSIDENYYSISWYCVLHYIDCPLDQAQIRWKRATQLSNTSWKSIGKAYDAKYGEIHTYHQDILSQIIM